MRKGLICGALAGIILLTLAGSLKAEGFKWGMDTATGDIVWDLKESGLGVGGGLNIASWADGLFLLRGELSTVNDKSKAGIGPGVDLVKLLQKTGATWIPKQIKSEVAILAAVDLTDFQINLRDDFSVQVIATILKVEF